MFRKNSSSIGLDYCFSCCDYECRCTVLENVFNRAKGYTIRQAATEDTIEVKLEKNRKMGYSTFAGTQGAPGCLSTYARGLRIGHSDSEFLRLRWPDVPDKTIEPALRLLTLRERNIK